MISANPKLFLVRQCCILKLACGCPRKLYRKRTWKLSLCLWVSGRVADYTCNYIVAFRQRIYFCWCFWWTLAFVFFTGLFCKNVTKSGEIAFWGCHPIIDPPFTRGRLWKRKGGWLWDCRAITDPFRVITDPFFFFITYLLCRGVHNVMTPSDCITLKLHEKAPKFNFS